MVNKEEFIKRLERILNYYSLSASAFADTIGVQRSSISHLLTGRNKPSLELVLKIVKNYPEVNLYWLLNGKGNFPSRVTPSPTPSESRVEMAGKQTEKKTVKKVIILYDDGSFESFEGSN